MSSGVYGQGEVSGAVCHCSVWQPALHKRAVEMEQHVCPWMKAQAMLGGLFLCWAIAITVTFRLWKLLTHPLFSCKHHWRLLVVAFSVCTLISLIPLFFFQYCINAFGETAWNSIKAMLCSNTRYNQLLHWEQVHGSDVSPSWELLCWAKGFWGEEQADALSTCF